MFNEMYHTSMTPNPKSCPTSLTSQQQYIQHPDTGTWSTLPVYRKLMVQYRVWSWNRGWQSRAGLHAHSSAHN